MEELITKVDNLKKQLDKTKQVTDIKALNEKVKKDKQLLSLIHEYQMTKKENIKQEILKNKLFREYKEKETDLNILILEINQELKKITKKGNCQL